MSFSSSSWLVVALAFLAVGGTYASVCDHKLAEAEASIKLLKSLVNELEDANVKLTTQLEVAKQELNVGAWTSRVVGDASAALNASVNHGVLSGAFTYVETARNAIPPSVVEFSQTAMTHTASAAAKLRSTTENAIEIVTPYAKQVLPTATRVGKQVGASLQSSFVATRAQVQSSRSAAIQALRSNPATAKFATRAVDGLLAAVSAVSILLLLAYVVVPFASLMFRVVKCVLFCGCCGKNRRSAKKAHKKKYYGARKQKPRRR